MATSMASALRRIYEVVRIRLSLKNKNMTHEELANHSRSAFLTDNHYMLEIIEEAALVVKRLQFIMQTYGVTHEEALDMYVKRTDRGWDQAMKLHARKSPVGAVKAA